MVGYSRGVLLSRSSILMVCLLIGMDIARAQQIGNFCVKDFLPGITSSSCAANDVRIEEIDIVSVTEACDAGTIGEAEVDVEVLVSADGSPDRFDIGLFFALDGDDARVGDHCLHDYLEPTLTTEPDYDDRNMDLIDDIFDGPWLDLDSDLCGDIASGKQAIKSYSSLRFPCVGMYGVPLARVEMSVCTSWDNNSNTACNALADAFPGTLSKCGCNTVFLELEPVESVPDDDFPWLLWLPAMTRQ